MSGADVWKASKRKKNFRKCCAMGYGIVRVMTRVRLIDQSFLDRMHRENRWAGVVRNHWITAGGSQSLQPNSTAKQVHELAAVASIQG